MKRYNLEYRGSQLRVEVNDKLLTSLYINGLCRHSQPLAVSGWCSLSSTIQTDYEWHEFIKADIVLNESEIIITISANNAILGSKSYMLDLAP